MPSMTPWWAEAGAVDAVWALPEYQATLNAEVHTVWMMTVAVHVRGGLRMLGTSDGVKMDYARWRAALTYVEDHALLRQEDLDGLRGQRRDLYVAWGVGAAPAQRLEAAVLGLTQYWLHRLCSTSDILFAALEAFVGQLCAVGIIDAEWSAQVARASIQCGPHHPCQRQECFDPDSADADTLALKNFLH